MAPRNANSGWSRGVSAVLAAVIVLGGVAVSLGFGVRLRSALERNAQNRVIAATTTLQATVTEQLARYVDTVRLAAAGMGAAPEPDAGTFERITDAMTAQKLTAARAVRFVAAATPETVGEVQATWRSRGAAGLELTPLKGAQQHLFTVFGRGLGGTKAPPAGVDQVAAPAEVEVTRLARTSNGVAVSDAYVLLSDRRTDPEKLSFDVAAPVLSGDRVIGYVLLSVAAAEFLTALVTQAAGDLLDVQVMTRAAAGTLTEVATVLHEGRHDDVRRAVDFDSGQRQWVLRTSADNRVLLPNAGRTDMVVVIAGSVLAVMFGSLMYLQMSATKRFEEEVELEVAERLRARDDDGQDDGQDVEDEKEEEPASTTVT